MIVGAVLEVPCRLESELLGPPSLWLLTKEVRGYLIDYNTRG